MTVLKGSILIPSHIIRAPCCHSLTQSRGKTEKKKKKKKTQREILLTTPIVSDSYRDEY